MNKEEKHEQVSALKRMFDENSSLVVAHYTGLTVAEMTDLRSRMRAAGATLRVAKNTLTLRALTGTRFEGVKDLFTGPTAIAVSKDPVAAAKVAAGFAKQNAKLVIVGGALQSERLDANRVKELATLPSLDELRAKIASLLKAPGTRIAAVLQAPSGALARVVAARSKSEGEAQGLTSQG